MRYSTSTSTGKTKLSDKVKNLWKEHKGTVIAAGATALGIGALAGVAGSSMFGKSTDDNSNQNNYPPTNSGNDESFLGSLGNLSATEKAMGGVTALGAAGLASYAGYKAMKNRSKPSDSKSSENAVSKRTSKSSISKRSSGPKAVKSGPALTTNVMLLLAVIGVALLGAIYCFCCTSSEERVSRDLEAQ